MPAEDAGGDAQDCRNNPGLSPNGGKPRLHGTDAVKIFHYRKHEVGKQEWVKQGGQI